MATPSTSRRRGLTLIELMIVIGVGGLVTYVISSVIVQQQRNSAIINVRNDFNGAINSLQIAVASSAHCTSAFKNVSINVGGAPTALLGNVQVMTAMGLTPATNGVGLTSLNLIVDGPSSAPLGNDGASTNFYMVEVDVAYTDRPGAAAATRAVHMLVAAPAPFPFTTTTAITACGSNLQTCAVNWQKVCSAFGAQAEWGSPPSPTAVIPAPASGSPLGNEFCSVPPTCVGVKLNY